MAQRFQVSPAAGKPISDGVSFSRLETQFLFIDHLRSAVSKFTGGNTGWQLDKLSPAGNSYAIYDHNGTVIASFELGHDFLEVLADNYQSSNDTIGALVARELDRLGNDIRNTDVHVSLYARMLSKVFPRRYFLPDEIIEGVAGIDFQAMIYERKAMIVSDVDGTLTYHNKGLPEIVARTLAGLRQENSEQYLRMVLVSNCSHARIDVIQELFSGHMPLPIRSVIRTGLFPKPLPFGYLAAERVLESIPSEMTVIGDQLDTDILAARLAWPGYAVHTILIDDPELRVGEPSAKIMRRLTMKYLFPEAYSPRPSSRQRAVPYFQL